jgi:putative sterol carrier protein
MSQFLSDEFMTEATAALAEHAGFSAAIAGTALDLQFVVSESPEGEISYYVAVADGTADMTRGTLDGADVTVRSTYETAVGISQGDINTQMAFMTGKLKVEGNVAKLLMNQTMLTEYARALSEIDVEY